MFWEVDFFSGIIAMFITMTGKNNDVISFE